MESQTDFLTTAPERGLTALEQAQVLEILGDEHYTEAGELLKHVKSFQALVMKSTDPVVKSAHAAHKAAKAQQNDLLKPVKEAAEVIGRKMGAYHAEMARQQALERAIEQQRLDEEVKAEALEFAEQIVDEDPERAMAMVDNAQAPRAKVPNLAPKSKGTQVRETWKFEIFDESLLPRRLMTPDMQKIGQIVRAMKGDAKINGVKTWSETKVH